MNAKPRTALITGASSGMGIAFAHELARRKYDLVVTARRIDLLQEIGQEVEQQFDVRVTALQSDLSAPHGAQALFDETRRQSIPIDLLVNNAGLGRFGPFLDQTWDELENMIAVNLCSVTQLTWLFAKDMAERGGGYILNHASFAAIQAAPDYAVYSGTKAYVLTFSRVAAYHLRRNNVRVSALCSGFIDTDFYEVAGQEPNWIVRLLMLKPAYVARTGVAGVLRGKRVIVPGIFYKIADFVLRFLPRRMATWLADIFVRV